MQCSHCGLCCKETQMPLSEADVERLERSGYSKTAFSFHDRRGYARLRNKSRYCFFYDRQQCRCKVYKLRPAGCRLYPVVFCDDDKTAMVDDLCPVRAQVSKAELEASCKKLVKLLRMLDQEAELRMSRNFSKTTT